MKYTELKEFALEILLEVLKTTQDQIERYKAIEDFSGVKKLTEEVLPKYEKLYLAFDSDSLIDTKEKEVLNFKAILVDIMLGHNLSEEYIFENIKLRRSLRNKSGSKMIKKLFEYQLGTLLTKKDTLLEKANLILDKEVVLEAKLSEAIQEIEQFDIIEELQPLRQNYSELSLQLQNIENEIKVIANKLEKKWYHEIYGTKVASEIEELLKNSI